MPKALEEWYLGFWERERERRDLGEIYREEKKSAYFLESFALSSPGRLLAGVTAALGQEPVVVTAVVAQHDAGRRDVEDGDATADNQVLARELGDYRRAASRAARRRDLDRGQVIDGFGHERKVSVGSVYAIGGEMAEARGTWRIEGKTRRVPLSSRAELVGELWDAVVVAFDDTSSISGTLRRSAVVVRLLIIQISMHHVFLCRGEVYVCRCRVPVLTSPFEQYNPHQPVAVP